METVLDASELVRRLMRQHCQRSEQRVEVRIPVTVSFGKASVGGQVLDMSTSGFRLGSNAILYPGQKFLMHMPQGSVSCEARWVSGLEAGGVFIGEIQADRA